MFDRLNAESARVLEEARAEAGRLDHNFVGTEHLLLGVLDVRDSPAAEHLASRGVVAEEVRAQIARAGALKRSSSDASPLPLTARAKQVMALAGREADDLGADSVAPVHLLLGIIRQGTGVAALVLRDLGVDLVELRDELCGAMTRRLEAGSGTGGERGKRGRRRGESGGLDVVEAGQAGGAEAAAGAEEAEVLDEPGTRGGDPVEALVGPACPRCSRPLAESVVVSELAANSGPATKAPRSRAHRQTRRSGSATVVVVSCGACGYPLSVSR